MIKATSNMRRREYKEKRELLEERRTENSFNELTTDWAALRLLKLKSLVDPINGPIC